MDKLRIEKDIPIPVSGQSSELMMLVKKMEVGDSIFVTTKKEVNSVRSLIERNAFRPVSRREGKGWRVWKTKREL